MEEGFSPNPSPRTFTKGGDKSTQCYKCSFWFVRPRPWTSIEASFLRWIANSFLEPKVSAFLHFVRFSIDKMHKYAYNKGAKQK